MPTNRADLARKVLISGDLERYVDINTDFGQTRDKAFFEKTGYRLLDFVSSVNIPCFVHDGDPREIMDSIETAKGYNCAIGAHIGYPDPENQGYQAMDLSPEELAAWIHVQLGGFQSMCLARGTEMVHVRPHGALYGKLLTDRETTRVVAETIYQINPWLILVGPAGPVLEETGREAGLRVAPEIYLGKRYNRQGRLLPENLLQNFDRSAQAILDQARQLINNEVMTTRNGSEVPVHFKTFHVSPQLDKVIELSEKLCHMLGQPVCLPIAEAGPSGWV